MTDTTNALRALADLREDVRKRGERHALHEEYTAAERCAARVKALDVAIAALATAQPEAKPESQGEAECPNCVTPWKCNGPHIGESPASGYEDATQQAQGGGEESA